MEEFIIINIYVTTPYAQHQCFSELKEIIIEILKLYKNHKIIITGDFNAPTINWKYSYDSSFMEIDGNIRNINHKQFAQTMMDYKFFQHNHIKNTNGKIIDLIFTNFVNNIQIQHTLDVNQIDKPTLHHSPLTIYINFSTHSIENVQRIRTVNFINLKKSKIEVDQYINSINNITQENIEVIINRLLKIQHKYTKKRTITTKYNKQPWIAGNKTYELMVKNKRTLWIRYKQTSNHANKDAYTLHQKNMLKLYHNLKDNYYKKIISEMKNSPINFYRFVNTRRKPDNPEIKNMHMNGINISDSDINNNFIDHFSNIFHNNYDNITDEMINYIHQIYYTQSTWITPISTNSIELTKLIKEIDIKKDHGPMGLESNFIKYNQNSFAKILAQIFNYLFQHAIVPESWKYSYITPVPKKGDKKNIANYRGIAMQNIVSKLFDKIITDRLFNNIKSFISKQQHGFYKGRSTLTNLISISEDLCLNNYNKCQTDVIYIDFSKAFDLVNHHRMAIKLSQLGTPLKFYKLIMNFIINRKYYLKINRKATDSSLTINCSVPQGSHCGPILFLIYCNDMFERIKYSKLLMYADDSKLYKIINNYEDQNLLQMDLNNIIGWAQENYVQINIDKTKIVSFYKSKTKKINSIYFIKDKIIEEVKQFKDLGITYDYKLNFNTHIDECYAKLNNMKYMFKRLSTELRNPDILKQVYNSYFLPIMEYNMIIFSNCFKTKFSKLDNITRYITRIICKTPWNRSHPNYKSYETRCCELKILKPHLRMEISLILNIIKILNNEEVTITQNKIYNLQYNNMRNLRRNQWYDERRMKYSSPIHSGLITMNKYQHIFNREDSINTIKKKLKEHLSRINNSTDDT